MRIGPHLRSPRVVKFGRSGGTFLKFTTRGSRALLGASFAPGGGRRASTAALPRCRSTTNGRKRALALPVAEVARLAVRFKVAAGWTVAASVGNVVQGASKCGAVRNTALSGLWGGERAPAGPIKLLDITFLGYPCCQYAKILQKKANRRYIRGSAMLTRIDLPWRLAPERSKAFFKPSTVSNST